MRIVLAEMILSSKNVRKFNLIKSKFIDSTTKEKKSRLKPEFLEELKDHKIKIIKDKPSCAMLLCLVPYCSVEYDLSQTMSMLSWCNICGNRADVIFSKEVLETNL